MVSSLHGLFCIPGEHRPRLTEGMPVTSLAAWSIFSAGGSGSLL
jgi:hypothetical protein